MFKKLLVISISVLVLAGCGEKKQVTEDMLIGNWDCATTVIKSRGYDSNGKLVIDNDDLGLIREYSLSFTQNESGLIQTKNNGKPVQINFKAKTVFDFMPLGSSNKENYSDEEYIFVSNDEFKIIVNTIERYVSSKQKSLEEQYETVCLRVTN